MTPTAERPGFAPAGGVLPLRTAVSHDGWIFVSGQVGHVEFRLVDGGFEAEMRQALRNLERELSRAGSGMAQVVKTTVLLASIDDFETMNRLYLEFFPPQALPARTAFAVAALPFGARVEIEAIAHPDPGEQPAEGVPG